MATHKSCFIINTNLWYSFPIKYRRESHIGAANAQDVSMSLIMPQPVNLKMVDLCSTNKAFYKLYVGAPTGGGGAEIIEYVDFEEEKYLMALLWQLRHRHEKCRYASDGMSSITLDRMKTETANCQANERQTGGTGCSSEWQL